MMRHAQAALVVSRYRGVHHFNTAAGQCEGEGPDGSVASPDDQPVDGCPVVEVCVRLTLQLRRLLRLMLTRRTRRHS